MRDWRSVVTKSQLKKFARDIEKSAKGDFDSLTVSQRDLLAALSERDEGLSRDESMRRYDVADSSVGFALTGLRTLSPQVMASVLAGITSVHKLDRLRKEMGETILAEHLLSLPDSVIQARYGVPRVNRMNRTPSSNRTLSPYRGIKAWARREGYTVPEIGKPRREVLKAFQKAHPERFAPSYTVGLDRTVDESGVDKANTNRTFKKFGPEIMRPSNNRVVELPVVPSDAKTVAEWNATSINRALKVITTARDLAQVGDITGARQLLKVVGMALQEA